MSTTRYALEVTITCPSQSREAANKLLDQLGYGPDNINIRGQGNLWSTVIPWPADDMAGLQRLADEQPKLKLDVSGRRVSKRATETVDRVKSRLDKADYQDDKETRAKARVVIADKLVERLSDARPR